MEYHDVDLDGEVYSSEEPEHRPYWAWQNDAEDEEYDEWAESKKGRGWIKRLKGRGISDDQAESILELIYEALNE